MSYTKQQFKQGEILRASQLNAMDDIISSHEERLDNIGTEGYLTADSLKTINGESLVGSGNIVISGSGGTGTVGPQGPQGEQGPKGDNGADGVSITSVKQTTTSSADGGTNVVTVTLSNGTTSTFNIKNGSKGSQGATGSQGPKGDTGATGEQGPKGDKGDTGANGANGTNGKDGADGVDGVDGATFTPSVDAEGNLSWTNNKGLTNPPAVNIKGPKGDAGESGGGSSGGPVVEDIDYQGYITVEDNKIYNFTVPITELSINVESELPIGSVLRFRTEFEGCTLTVPDSVFWANGVLPDLISFERYELSLTTIDVDSILAVLTPFKPV